MAKIIWNGLSADFGRSAVRGKLRGGQFIFGGPFKHSPDNANVLVDDAQGNVFLDHSLANRLQSQRAKCRDGRFSIEFDERSGG